MSFDKATDLALTSAVTLAVSISGGHTRSAMVEPLAITTEQACRLTCLSKHQLRYWDETRFFSPTVLDEKRRFGRIYSFRDVVGLRTIAQLRNRVSLQELRRVGEWLRKNHETPWSSLRFFIDNNNRVHFHDPASGHVLPAADKRQTVATYALDEIAADVRREARQMQTRGKSEIGRVARNRYVLHRAPLVAGTRIPTAAIWRFHEAGYSTDKIISEYPQLSRRDVRAALRFERQQRTKRRTG